MVQYRGTCGLQSKEWQSGTRQSDQTKLMYTVKHRQQQLKRNTLLIHTTAWTNSRVIQLSEERQTKNSTHGMIPVVGNSRKC